MSDIATCGQGLAFHSAFHSKVADLLATVGKNLELHLRSLDPDDDASRPEHAAYSSLVTRHRELVDHLRETADEMVSYRDLPMANHDMEVLMSSDVMDAFRDLIARQDELAQMLAEWVERDRAMLEESGGDGSE